MSAKSTDLGKVQEIYDVVVLTKRQIEAVDLTREKFLDPPDDKTDLMAEGIMNRVLRVAEEAGRVEADTASKYGFDSVGARGVRNRLAHAYGDVDREIVWQVIESDFDALLKACLSYCEDKGIDIMTRDTL
ncbi:MAG TPA: hypothetical protein DCP91_11180 [Eggerthellaceae bacterium]|nr:hypothetical protein [Eggerthellaceae bacterium]